MIHIKLKRFKQFFKGWGFNRQGEQKAKKKAMHEELSELELLEEEGLLSITQVMHKAHLITELLKINVEEEIYWQQRSHDKQLREGDNNTKYLHRMASRRRRKNLIISMEDEDRIIEGDAELLAHATKYYKTLFGPAEGNSFPLDPTLWNAEEKVSMEENDKLSSPFH